MYIVKPHIVVFDAHWDKYSKVNQIYDSIYEVLNENEKKSFKKGLTLFKERQKEIQKEACSMLADCVARVQKIEIISQKGSYSKAKVKRQIGQFVLNLMVKFTEDVNALYKVAAEYPTETKQALQTRIQNNPDLIARLNSGAGAVAIIGSGGAALGAALGAAVSSILTGGLGPGAGAVLGAQIGFRRQ